MYEDGGAKPPRWGPGGGARENPPTGRVEMGFAPKGRDDEEDVRLIGASIRDPIAAEERYRDSERLKPHPRYLFCSALTAVSISIADVSLASVTIADRERRSTVPGPAGGKMRTAST